MEDLATHKDEKLATLIGGGVEEEFTDKFDDSLSFGSVGLGDKGEEEGGET